jgi:hypothetical protein
VKKKIGPAWTGRGRPRVGYFTRPGAARRSGGATRSMMRASAPTPAPSGPTPRSPRRRASGCATPSRTGPASPRGCAPIARRRRRTCSPPSGQWSCTRSPRRGIERWRAGLTGSARRKNKLLTELYGVFRRAQKVYGLERNPASEVEKLRQRRRLDLDVFTPEEVRALCRRRGDRTGRGDLSHRGLHRAAPRRADRAALARRRLPRLPHPGLRLLRRRAAHRAQERQGPLRPARVRSRRSSSPVQRSRCPSWARTASSGRGR